MKSKASQCYCKVDPDCDTQFILDGVDKNGKSKDICDICENLCGESKVEEVPKNPPPKSEKKKISEIVAEMEGIRKLR